MGVRHANLVATLVALLIFSTALGQIGRWVPRILQQANRATLTVTTMVDVGHGFTSTFNGVNPPPFSAIHMAYDLRLSSNQTLNATLVFQPNGTVVSNQLTILIPSSYNVVNLQFSQDCVFPVAASSATLNGVNPNNGSVSPQTARQWLSIFTSNAFEVFADQMGFGGLNSSVPGNVTVTYPQGSKVAAQSQGLYAQTLRFANTTRSFRILQIYCPVTDSGSGGWSVNITGSWVPGPVIQTNNTNATANSTNNTNVNSTANATSNNTTINTTNNTNGTNGTFNPNDNNGQIPTDNNHNEIYRGGNKLNVAALVIGLVLGILLLIAIVAIVILCIKLSKKRQDIITDDGYGPDAGFKRFDKQEKVVNVAEYNTGSGIHQAPTSNSLPLDSNIRGKSEGETGFGWRQNETVVVADDDHVREDPFGRPAKFDA